MDKKFMSGGVAGPPSAADNASGPYPTNGNPGGGVPPTNPGAYWFHMIDEEMINVIAGAGLSPDKTDLTQLRTAIATMIATANLGVGYCSYLLNGKIERAIGSNAVTFSVKRNDTGSDPSAGAPVHLVTRDATANSSTWTVTPITAVLSLTISSGSTLGTTNGSPFNVWIVGFLDGSTPRLGAVNVLSGNNIMPLAGFGIASSTAEGGAGGADSAQVIYTGTAVTAKPYSILAYASWQTGLAAAGTWDALPTRMQMVGFGTPLPGAVIQRVSSPITALVTCTATIPVDDTIPQIGEGSQVNTVTINRNSASNVLRIESHLPASRSASAGGVRSQQAIFQDGGANALKSSFSQDSIYGGTIAPLVHEMKAGASGSSTFTVRAGCNSGNLDINGDGAGARIHGGVGGAFVSVEEYQA